MQTGKMQGGEGVGLWVVISAFLQRRYWLRMNPLLFAHFQEHHWGFQGLRNSGLVLIFPLLISLYSSVLQMSSTGGQSFQKGLPWLGTGPPPLLSGQPAFGQATSAFFRPAFRCRGSWSCWLGRGPWFQKEQASLPFLSIPLPSPLCRNCKIMTSSI